MRVQKGRDRVRIAYVTPNAILPPNRGGRVRAHHLWRALSGFADVIPIMVGDQATPGDRRLARQAGAKILPRRPYSQRKLAEAIRAGTPVTLPGLWEVTQIVDLPEPLFAALSDAPALVRHCLDDRRAERIVALVRRSRADVVVLCDISMGLLAPALRSLGVRIVVGPHNFDSGLYDAMAAAAPTEGQRRWNAAAAKAFGEAERLIAPYVDQLWVCSPADARRFAAVVPPEKIRVVPNVYDIGRPSPVPATRDLVFVGQGDYFPNRDAAHRLLAMSERLDGRGVAHRLRIVGRAAPGLRESARRHPSVEVLGEVPSVVPYLEAAAIVPIALTVGGGTRLKILEAMAAGRPVLSTPVGIEGIAAQDGIHAVIEPDTDAFADRVTELFGDKARAAAIAAAGWELVRQNYSPATLQDVLQGCLEELGATAPLFEDAILACNLGAECRHESVVFNRGSRLLTWTFQVRVAAPAAALSGAFASAGGTELPNAVVAVRPDREGFAVVEATAVLPLDVPPETVRLTILAWGSPILHRAPQTPVPIEQAGLMTIEPDGEGLKVTGWSLGEPVTVDLRGGGAPVRTVAASPGRANVFECHLPSTQGTVLTVATAGGTAQTFHRPGAWVGQTRPANARLRALENRHAGEAAWIIGNGPSVRIPDVEALQGRLTFCFNRFHLAYDRMAFRPTYTVTGDQQMIEDFGQDIVDQAGGTVFVVHDRAPDLLGDYVWVRMAPVYPPLFSKAAEMIVSPGGSSLFMAMQIGYVMGIRRFYLYGMDFKFVFEAARGGDAFRIATGDNNHFIPNYRSGKAWCPPSLRDIGASFLAARHVFEHEGGFVRNASRGGLMEMFDRVPFEAAVRETAGNPAVQAGRS